MTLLAGLARSWRGWSARAGADSASSGDLEQAPPPGLQQLDHSPRPARRQHGDSLNCLTNYCGSRRLVPGGRRLTEKRFGAGEADPGAMIGSRPSRPAADGREVDSGIC